MRLVFALAMLAGTAALAQQPVPAVTEDDDSPRFGVRPKLKTYPQETAKKALAATIEAVEKGDVSYLVAQLLDPGFVELRIADRAKQYEAAVELDLARLRDLQARNPEKFAPEDRLPNDRAKFNALIIEQSRERAFKQLVKDVEMKLLDDPQAMRDLKKLYRDGTLSATETGAKLTHADVKDRALYFRKIGTRFFLENRHEDAPPPKKDPGKGPDEKKM